MGVILECKLVRHNKQIPVSELPCVSLFQIFSAAFLPNVIWTGLQLGSYHKNKKSELFIETVYNQRPQNHTPIQSRCQCKHEKL